MKKSTRMSLIGFILIIAALIADGILSNMINFADASQFGITQYAAIVIVGIALIVGIVLIVVGRKEAKKEKSKETV